MSINRYFDLVKAMFGDDDVLAKSALQLTLMDLFDAGIKYASGDIDAKRYSEATFAFRLKIDRLRQPCPECHGQPLTLKGKDEKEITAVCPTCRGRGWTWKANDPAPV